MNKIQKFCIASFISTIIGGSGILSTSVGAVGFSATSMSIIDKSPTMTAEEPTISDGEIVGNLRFNQLGDFVTYELTLENTDSEQYRITSISDNNTDGHISLEYEYDEEFVPVGDETTATIKLSYVEELINQNLSLDDLVIKISYGLEDGTTGEIVFVPDTGVLTGEGASAINIVPNIICSAIVAILTGVGIFIIVRKRGVRDAKYGIAAIALAIVFIPFAAFAERKFETSIKFGGAVEIAGRFEEYDVEIDADNGSTPITRKITYGEPIGELPEYPEKTGYSFDIWEDEEGNEITPESIITGETSVSAKYRPLEYAISYDLAGGALSEENPATYTIEDDDIVLHSPKRTGYTFIGWTGSNGTTPETSVTIPAGSLGDITFTANFTPRTDIPYKVAHGYQSLNYDWYYEGEEDYVTYYGTADDTIEVPLLSKYGFEDPEIQTVKIKPDGTTEVAYHYDRKNFSFSVTNRDDVETNCQWGYRCSDDGTYPYETTIRVKAKSRTGYHVTWNDDSTDYEREFPLTEDTVLSLTYAPNHYTVRYDKGADDATGEMADQEFVYDEEQALHSNEFSRTGYTFSSWRHGNETWQHHAPENWSTKNLTSEDGGVYTFYANWSPIRCRVEYYDAEHGGSYWITNNYFYDQKVPELSFIPSKQGYVFAGFYADADYTTPMDFENTVLKGDTYVYIKFVPES